MDEGGPSPVEREIEVQSTTDTDSIKKSLADLLEDDYRSIHLGPPNLAFENKYLKMYSDAVEAAKRKYDPTTFEQVRRGLFDIATQGKIGDAVLVEVDELPGRWSRKQTPLNQRMALMNIYVNNPELAYGVLRERIIGGHGSSSASILDVMEEGLRPQAKVPKDGKFTVSGEGVQYIFSGFHEQTISFVQWHDLHSLNHYAHAFSQPINDQLLEERIEQVDEQFRAFKADKKSGYGDYDEKAGKKNRAKMLLRFNLIKQNLQAALAFLRKPNKNDEEKIKEDFLRSNFPVIYLINHPSRDSQISIPRSGLHSEFMVHGGVGPEHIEYILVPSDKVAEVQKMIEKRGKDWRVSSLDSVEPLKAN